MKKRTAQPSFTGCGPSSEKGSASRAPRSASIRALSSASPGDCGSKDLVNLGESIFSGIATLQSASHCGRLGEAQEAILGRVRQKSQSEAEFSPRRTDLKHGKETRE